jgi:hypothetical protein
VGEETNVCRILLGMAEGKKSLERHRLRWHGRIILTFILSYRVGTLWSGFIWLRAANCGGLL